MVFCLFVVAYYVWRWRFLSFAIEQHAGVPWVAHEIVGHSTWLVSFLSWLGCMWWRPLPPSGGGGAPSSCWCKVCQKHVAGFDHHCVFLANCVGLHNKALFHAFLGVVTLGSLYATAVSCDAFMLCIGTPLTGITMRGLYPAGERPREACRGVGEMSIVCLPTLGTCFMLACLFAWQMALRLHGDTTAEFIRRVRLRYLGGGPKRRG